MKIVCRAKLSPNCYDGRIDCTSIYGEDSMADDGTFDGQSVVCDPCYIAGGQPSLDVRDVTSREQVVEHVNRELGLVPEHPATARLRALTSELRDITAKLFSDLTPEKVASLTDEQLASLRDELVRLKGISGKVMRDIEAHIAGEE